LSIHQIQLPKGDLNRKTSWYENGSPEIRTQDQSVKSRWLTPESHCYDWSDPQKFQKSFKNAPILGVSKRSHSEKT